MRSLARPAHAIAGVVLTATLLTGCSSQFNTNPFAQSPQHEPIGIMVDANEADQLVLAEIFRQELMGQGREASIVKEEIFQDTQGGRSMNPGGNFYVGCTGVFLSALNPGEARAISKDYKKAQKASEPGGEDYLARTHIALMSSLTTDTSTVEPSGASGCEDAEPELPENFVVLYQDDLFDREERQAVASLTKFITQKDISDMVEEMETKDASAEKVVRSWMNSSGADIAHEEGDSDSSGGSDLTGGSK
ncbi:hypothetical protein [Corynebacterium yonathiae]|uniref:Uncharacterized protein n=1 Tax=Corynebacterium yonathiae TaxID=2913504 RepID=A0A9X3RM65_9CORY|nr:MULTISPECIES: hypothetical protein [Corynebacterium]MCZ9297095.1 hypothetical protein [Corynebacterium yonathiae]MDK2584124.1 hypothetical protein [Corynebacterium sp. BWA136]